MTLTILWKSPQKILENMPWKYFCSRSASFSFHIFGWPFLVKSRIFEAVEPLGDASKDPCCIIKNAHLYSYYWPWALGRNFFKLTRPTDVCITNVRMCGKIQLFSIKNVIIPHHNLQKNTSPISGSFWSKLVPTRLTSKCILIDPPYSLWYQ